MILPASFVVQLFLTKVKSTELRSAIVSRMSLIWRGFQYWVPFFGEESRVLKNTPSTRKQLSRGLCIVVILSRSCTGVVLALFQVLAFATLCLNTLNNICCHVCISYKLASLNLTFSRSCYVRAMLILFATLFVLLLLIVANINICTFSSNVSSKFGLRFTIATIRLGSMSLNLRKVISFPIFLCQFRIFLIILHNSIKTAFSVI